MRYTLPGGKIYHVRFRQDQSDIHWRHLVPGKFLTFYVEYAPGCLASEEEECVLSLYAAGSLEGLPPPKDWDQFDWGI